MKPKHTRHSVSRRAFLQAAATTMALGGCGLQYTPNDEPAPLTDSQRERRKKGDSSVAVIACESYEENIAKLLKQYAGAVGLPDLTGKSVVIKPNMIEYRPDKPVTIDPAMIAAAAELVDSLGAREITIAEGPGHFRDTEFLLDKTGIGKVCTKLGLRFVDLNLDDLEKVDNLDGVTKAREFYLPRTILEAGAVVSLPKLKTHHWVGMTASMKNLFGTVPGRKYGWPKNFLHWLGIDLAIIDLVHLVRPSFAIVDAIIAMEGDGPINGVAKHAGAVIMGTDLAAVDATGARLIGVDPEELKYLRLAHELVGNTESARIKLVGAPLDSVRQLFAMPVTFQHLKRTEQSEKFGS